MNYERIIVELLSRIQTLEEQVATLLEEKQEAPQKGGNKIGTKEIRDYIQSLKNTAKEKGESFVILKSGDIHRDLDLKSAWTQVCNAMRQSMKEGDVVLHTTPSGNSSTIEIQFYV